MVELLGFISMYLFALTFIAFFSLPLFKTKTFKWWVVIVLGFFLLFTWTRTEFKELKRIEYAERSY